MKLPELLPEVLGWLVQLEKGESLTGGVCSVEKRWAIAVVEASQVAAPSPDEIGACSKTNDVIWTHENVDESENADYIQWQQQVAISYIHLEIAGFEKSTNSNSWG